MAKQAKRKNNARQTAAKRASQAGSGKTSRTRHSRKASVARRPSTEKTTLLNLEEIVRQRIVGKEEEIQRVANTIRIRRTDLDFRPNRPDGAFLLVGPAGTGKTEFAFAFGEALLGSEDKVLLLDMADYSDENDLQDLLVTPLPGTDDTLVEGALTTPVRKNPRAVILLRGVERAHPNFNRMLLHILDRGKLSDAQGDVPFNQTIIFATTRLHPDETEVVEQIGFNRSTLPRSERSRRMLEERFTPEVVSAFNGVLYFDSLTTDDVRAIARCKVNMVLERLKRQRRGVVVSEKVYDTFIKEDEVRQAGARYLNRALEEKLFTPLSKYLLAHARARKITVEVEGERVIIHEAGKR